jgi:hypothetical protein
MGRRVVREVVRRLRFHWSFQVVKLRGQQATREDWRVDFETLEK